MMPYGRFLLMNLAAYATVAGVIVWLFWRHG